MRTTTKNTKDAKLPRFEVVLEVDLHINLSAENAIEAKRLAVELVQAPGFCQEGNMLAMKISKVKEL